MGSRYLGRKLGQAVLTIFAIVILNFLLFRMMPGSPERVLLRNPNLSQQQLEAVKARWGLDKPLIPDQLVAYVGSTLTGDLGYSLKFQGKPVVDVISDSLWPTVLLIGLGELVAIVVGLTVGAYAGWRRGSAVDRVGTGASLILYSMPYFVIGMPLIIVFAAGLHWFPTSGMTSVGTSGEGFVGQLVDLGRHLVLPLTTVALGLIGSYSIIMRSAILETRSEDYMTTARAKGITDGRMLRSHAFPNALLPMVTIIAINLGYVVAGAITAEVVFNWPGLGSLTVDALGARDYPILQGVFLLLSVAVVVANLVADLVYGLLDPRVRS
ncbi:MAG TPA: ABC transporter permease [Candidatus Limnocylindrales bacterium]|nr:ABC transporter permease [Candidatus Limnocylindrales bacterium]